MSLGIVYIPGPRRQPPWTSPDWPIPCFLCSCGMYPYVGMRAKKKGGTKQCGELESKADHLLINFFDDD